MAMRGGRYNSLARHSARCRYRSQDEAIANVSHCSQPLTSIAEPMATHEASVLQALDYFERELACFLHVRFAGRSLVVQWNLLHIVTTARSATPDNGGRNLRASEFGIVRTVVAEMTKVGCDAEIFPWRDDVAGYRGGMAPLLRLLSAPPSTTSDLRLECPLTAASFSSKVF
jgi:hypothetical protein